MNSVTKLGLFLFVWCISSTAQAGDHWEECTNTGGIYQFESNKLYSSINGTREEVEFQKLRTITLSEKEGFCENKAGERFSWSNHAYVMELKTPLSEGPFTIWFICEAGGSGFPASPNIDTKCVKEVTTKDRQLQPEYKDLAQ